MSAENAGQHSDQPNPPQQHHASDDELLESAIPIDEGEPAADDASAAEDPEALEIEEDESEAETPRRPPKIQALGERQRHHHEYHWKRSPNTTGHGAVHVRTFVAKLRPDAIEHLDEQINQWLDNHPEYEVKFVTTATGPLIGKMTEDALFVNVWV